MSKLLDFMDHIEKKMDEKMPHVAHYFVAAREDKFGRQILVYQLDYMARNPFRFQQRRARREIERFMGPLYGICAEERVGHVVVQIPER